MECRIEFAYTDDEIPTSYQRNNHGKGNLG
jgi:hypothetical protein